VSSSSEQERGRLEQRARMLFDESVEQLDAHTRSKLTQARHAALGELSRARPWQRWQIWAPAGGLVAAAIVAVAIGFGPGGDASRQAAVPLEDLDIVADAENLDLLQEVEFYSWLADEPAASGDSG
jgi:hypothetical protein